MLKNIPSILKNPIFYAFGLSILYWGYLFMTTQPVLSCDANLYDLLGKMVHNKGWAHYFSQGPLQEPLFPLIISWSLRLSELFGPSYLAFQKGFQLFWLFITQLLTLNILRQLRINRRLGAAVIFYLGFSPALVNSALSLYSEIVVYPSFWVW